jgi:hypothetical protein
MAIELENMPSNSLASKDNTAVTSQLRTLTKIIRSMKEGLGGRKCGKTKILMDSPEKKEIETQKVKWAQ